MSCQALRSKLELPDTAGLTALDGAYALLQSRRAQDRDRVRSEDEIHNDKWHISYDVEIVHITKGSFSSLSSITALAVFLFPG